MKNIIKKGMPLFLLFALGFSMQFLQSCRKNTYNGTAIPYNNSATVVASIMGFVTDESGAIIKDATVTTGGYTTLSDENGYFHFDNITTPSHATTVYVTKNTYFKGSRTIAVNANQKHVVKVGLIAKGIPETFVAANGGNVTFAGGLTLGFPANGIINQATGLAYTGQVYVYAHKIDPTTESGRNTMPGDLRGVTAVGSEERLLQSFGMMVAELYSVDGQLLQIANGSEATMTMTVPTSLQGSAPANIPLWYFDETKGVWAEQGVATLTGGKYIGKVKHFSFWNCDQPAAAIDIQFTLVDQNNNALSGYSVKLTNTANNDARWGTTNTSGWVGGLCYPNATLTLEVFALNSICGSSTAIYTQTVVTSSINLNLGTITVPIVTPSAATITGSIVDCSSNALTNASVVISPYNIVVTPNSLGQFTYTFPCTPTSPITIYAYDLGNNVYGTTTATLVSGVNNLGVLNACGNVSPFLSISMTNTTTSISYNNTFTIPSGNIYAMVDSNTATSNSTISAYGILGGTTSYVSMTTTDTIAGTFPISTFNAYLSGAGFTDQSYTVQSGSTITYTSFPLFPGDVLGTYSVSLIGIPSGNTYTATGSFRAPRQN